MSETTISIDAAIAAAVKQAVAEYMPPMPTPERKADKYVLTVKQLAARMQISLPAAYDLTHIENFPVILIGRRRLIPVEAFEKWLAENSGTGRG